MTVPFIVDNPIQKFITIKLDEIKFFFKKYT